MRKGIKKKVRFYMITSASKKKYGAFPLTPEGRERAESLVTKLEKENKEQFKIEKV